MNQNILFLTSKAINQIKFLIQKYSTPIIGIRIKVIYGGCNGNKYHIMYENFKNTLDEEIKIDNFSILIDSKSLLYLIGSTIDYIDTFEKSGFVFQNPKYTNNCGCGKSFSI